MRFPDVLRRQRLISWFASQASALRPYLPPVNFITLHYAYFTFSSLALAAIFWACGSPASREIYFIDSLFMATSALTGTGLNTVNLSEMSTGQQVVLFMAMLLGHPVLISLWTVLFRRHIFERRFRAIVRAERERRLRAGSSMGLAAGLSELVGIPRLRTPAKSRSNGPGPSSTLPGLGTKIPATGTPRPNALVSPALRSPNHPDANSLHQIETDELNRDVEAGLPPIAEVRPDPRSPGSTSIVIAEPPHPPHAHAHAHPPHPYPPVSYPHAHPYSHHQPIAPSSQIRQHDHDQPPPPSPPPTATEHRHLRRGHTLTLGSFLDTKRHHVSRNGGFFNLTLREREYLGGVEYRALEILIVVVSLYYVLWQALGAIALGAWLASRSPEAARDNAQNPWWMGVFLGVSAFANGGLHLGDAGMSAFQQGGHFVLAVVLVVMVAGSRAAPAILRATVWGMAKAVGWAAGRAGASKDSQEVWKETFAFILKYPRRVYISMFPARATWVLLGWLGGFIAVDWALFFALNVGNEALDRIPLGDRVMDGLFQSVCNADRWGFLAATLSGGFAVISISAVYCSLQVFWLIKMYASAYPTSVTVRGSNVYEERSLGIYAGDEPHPGDAEVEDDDDNDNDEDDKREGAGGLFVSGHDQPGGMQQQLEPPLLSPKSTTSRVSRLSSASRNGMDKLAALGLGGTAAIGRRLVSFHGVGVTPAIASSSSSSPSPCPGRAGANKRVAFSTACRVQVHHPTPGPSPCPSGVNTAAASIASLGSRPPSAPAPDLVAHHVRSQLSHDVWWIALAFFVVTVIETQHALADPTVFSLFNMLFEIVSAYANNGVSIGLPSASYSFSGAWRGGSKLVLVLVMLRGRHRDLPVALDRAVKLPSIDLDEHEEEDQEVRRAMSRSSAGVSPMMAAATPRVRAFSPRA
ncbi:hypothetical protein VTJ83DRAFT_2763 [Remersonia thermophila]|uniref:Potassium transport protein n=1 Tax=Remersonia thermophila TaxID=72144 RepID=A0ABR4DJS0_9PEZI